MDVQDIYLLAWSTCCYITIHRSGKAGNSKGKIVAGGNPLGPFGETVGNQYVPRAAQS